MNRFVKSVIAGAALVGLLLVGTHGVEATSAAPAMERASVNYFYAGMEQYGLSVSPKVTTSASALMDPETATILATDTGGHSLGEIAVKSADQKEIIEIGWQVGGVFSGTAPHLFGGEWINGSFQGYGTGGVGSANWVDYTGGVNLGDDLTTYVGTATQFGIELYMGNWWLAFNGSYIGYFTGSQFTGPTAFPAISIVQGFGEVASQSTTPCTNMGKGTLATGPTSPTGAKVSSMTYTGSNADTPVLTALSVADATKYNDVLLTSNRTVYFGGPGWTTSPNC